jgi:hypothetical protein
MDGKTEIKVSLADFIVILRDKLYLFIGQNILRYPNSATRIVEQGNKVLGMYKASSLFLLNVDGLHKYSISDLEEIASTSRDIYVEYKILMDMLFEVG